MSSFISPFMWNCLDCCCGCLAVLPLPSPGMDWPWCPVSMTFSTDMHAPAVFLLCCGLGFFNAFFHIVFSCLLFSESSGALHSPVWSVDKSLTFCFYRYAFQLKCTFFSPGVDKRRAIPEWFYYVLLCCLRRYVVIMSFSSSAFTSWLGCQVY